MSWTPDPEALEQLKAIIGGTLSSNNNDRNHANESLIQAKQQPEIENYLFYILVVDETAKSDVRAASGINLKNIILKNANRGSRQYILDNITNGLLSNDNMVRNTSGNVITALFSIYGLENWPQVLGKLLELANSSQNQKAAEAAMSALSKISEDSHIKLDVEVNGERPLDYLLSVFIKLMDSPSSRIRALAVECINFFIPSKSQSSLAILDEFMQKLFVLANDSNEDIKKNVCRSFSSILEARPDKLLPHINGVITYCLHLMRDEDEEVSLEGCEFLLALATSPAGESDSNVFKSRLSDILPVLLEKMVYSEEEIFFMRLVDEKDDAHMADNEEDIKPQNAKSKDSHKAASNRASSRSKQNFGDDFDEEDDDDYYYDGEEDSDDDTELDQWSVRKCSAASLDVLSVNLPVEVLQVTLPILQERIVSNEWEVREAAILAFGAISKSCMELERDKLPTLVPFLVDRLQDDEPRVRQITCWTLSRYSSWVAEEAHEVENMQIILILLSNLF